MAGVDSYRVVFLGPPGSGKGTQAALLAGRLGVPAISTGDMLRRAVADGTELGQRVDAVMAAGDLVGDELMAEIVRDRLAQSDRCVAPPVPGRSGPGPPGRRETRSVRFASTPLR